MSYLTVNERPIWFEKFGSGPNIVLVVPGAIGTWKTDFEIQFDPKHKDHLDFNKFTYICVELPGWGRSCPPERDIGPLVLHQDAERLFKLMEMLGHQTYSIYAWSEGSKVALIMARLYGHTDRIKCLIIQGTITYASESGTKRILWSRDIQNWDVEMLLKYKQAYDGDIDRVEDLWQRHLDSAIVNYAKYYPNGLLGPVQEGLQKVLVPTLLIHGDRDFFVESAQAELIVRHIPNCQLIRFPNCGHNLHQIESNRFKQIVEKFLGEHL